MEIEAPRTLLVLKPSSFGDIIHTLPAVSRLKAAWPQCRVSWLVNPEWAPLLDGNPDVDEVIAFPRAEFRGWGGGWRMAKWLRAEIAGRRPDLAVDFQGLLRSALIGRASGTRRLMGLSDAREGARWFYHRTVVSPRQPVHAIERYLTLAEAAVSGGKTGGGLTANQRILFQLPEGRPPEDARDLHSEFVLVHPYARGSGKSLNRQQIHSLLLQYGKIQVVLVGRGDAEIAVENRTSLNLLNRTTLPQLIWLIRRAACVVSVDSGPAHLAAALDKPMVAIHAWTDPRKVGPYRPDAWVWKNGTLTQVRHLNSMDASFFEPKPLQLQQTDLAAIARVTTSPSDFSA